jgi:class 3 adenylate cyclase/tetratricopeptide (TPR) repeat protein
MQEIANWLEKLGMSQYAQRFAENDIDVRALRYLTDQDLKDIGVSLGHRRRMLAAISELTGAAPVTSGPRATTELEPQDAAERRQLTIMFCDLVGSTALAARHDVEDLREMIGAYHGAVTEAVRNFDGWVAKYMGDGVLAYFGYPLAHEDDAERAVRAGLAVVEAVRRLETIEPLQVRIGLATGLVVVGDLIGEGSAQERSVVGETPNLAARLQALAEPDAIVIAASTRRLVGDLFECQSLGEIEIKGLAGPIPAYCVLGESRVGSRFKALRSGETPFIARQEEIELLKRRWTQAKAGAGSIVLISSEPGIGKSRLTEVFRQKLASDPHTRLRYFCSPHYQDSALYPITTQLQRAADFEGGDSPEVKLSKLEVLVSAGAPAEGDVPLLAALLSLPFEGRYPPIELSPPRKKEKTFEALLRQFTSLAQRGPVLMVFEDLQWADPTSRELLDLIIQQIDRLPVLLIATFRPEFNPSWTGQPHVTTLSLGRLRRDESDKLVRQIIKDRMALSSEMVDEIVERTDGVPLFLEELTKAVLETGVLSTVPGASTTVPATLHASLIARLDRLGSRAKEIAQVGAAIGRNFAYDLLAAVSQRTERELRDALGRLVDAGLVLQRGVPPQAAFLFKHALVQDTAYSLLLRGPRRTLHARIARVLERQFPEVSAAQPETLAHHFTQAGMSAEAIDFWTKAGILARGRSAFAEATAHLRRGLELLPSLPDSSARAAKELPIQTSLGVIHLATSGVASVEAAEAYARARDICEQINDTDQLMGILIGLRHSNQVQGRCLYARDYASRCLDIARRKGNRIFAVQANANLAHTLCIMGSFVDARSRIAEALAEYDQNDYLAHRAVSGIDPASFCLGIAGWNEWFLGYPDQALQAALQGVAVARSKGYPQTEDQALHSAAHTHLLRREPEAAESYLDSALAISREHGFRQRIAMVRLMRGWALASQTEGQGALTELSEGLAGYRSTGARAWQTNFLALLAIGYLRAGRYAEGLSTIAEAQSLTTLQDEYWWRPELHRLEGDLLLASAGLPGDRVEGCYQNAMESARQQKAKSWELRAIVSLARLLRDQGRRAEARDHLAPIYDWFTEGFGTLDLKEAKALLDELA